jgi:iron(II)-dependent oxidoreductase
MSPLVWDLAHIAAYEDLWLCHRHAGMELSRPELASLYDAFETPRAVRADLELLDAAQAREYMEEVRERSAQALLRCGVGDGTIVEMVLRHELQHTETMRQTMMLAGLLPAGEPPLEALPGREGWQQIPAGSFQMGAGADGFSYDNERSAHRVSLAPYAIARLPVSNAGVRGFHERGGYSERRWWSQAGWEWLQVQRAAPHEAILHGEPRAAACHLSWYEADAFARAHGASLPSEAQWERAARAGAIGGVSRVWEWTGTWFGGYPGFRAHPYREYSEVFFGERYRVLRGGSWATSPRVAQVTFRNWDLPERRQIFAGARLVRER